jgi:hypothetical protein
MEALNHDDFSDFSHVAELLARSENSRKFRLICSHYRPFPVYRDYGFPSPHRRRSLFTHRGPVLTIDFEFNAAYDPVALH